MFTVGIMVGIGISPRMQRVSCDEPSWPGFLQTSIQVPMLLWAWLQFELVCYDPRTMLMPLSQTEQQIGKLANAVEMASLDVEMMKWEWSYVRGGMATVNFAWIRACVKARLLDDPNYPDQQSEAKENNRNYMLNALLILEDSVSRCL